MNQLIAFLLLSSALATCQAALPNFLIIVGDDLCWRDLGYQGHPDVKTPHIDRLAAEGMRFENMFNPAATCSPTRHALYTGLYPVRSGAFPNHTRVYEGTKSIFTLLKERGYRVALQNKSHVGPSESFPYESINGADDLTRTAAFIKRDVSQPWMLSYCSNDPHGPWTRGPKNYDPAKITVPPYMHDNTQTRQMLAAYFSEITQLDEQVGNLMQLLDETKQAENTVVLFVSEQGCSLPYGGKWSLYDTGVRTSSILRWPGVVKPGSQTNALIQYVDITPTFLEIAGGDPATTDTGCPDVDANRGFDGRSFVPILKGTSEGFRDHVFAQHTTVGVNGYKDPYPSRMVRDTRYKLIRNFAPENTFTIGGIHKGEPLASWQEAAKSDPKLAARVQHLFKRPGEELYDLETDPFELNNLATDPGLTEIKSRLQKELEEWMRQQGDKGLETEMLAPTRQGNGAEESDEPKKKGKGKGQKK
jgi:N-sulfoglucosamine sulfohydrolase